MKTTELSPGDRVEWKYEPRGGYCIGWWVPAAVVRVGPKRVVVDALLAAGGVKRVTVKAERLRPAKA